MSTKQNWKLHMDGVEWEMDERPEPDGSNVDDGFDDPTEFGAKVFFCRFHAVNEETGEEIDGEVRHDPVCPVEDPDWQSPYKVVGGCKENPGVYGSGGGVNITEVDAKTGIYRITNTWDQDVSGDGVPHESITYLEADESSLNWVEENRK